MKRYTQTSAFLLSLFALLMLVACSSPATEKAAIVEPAAVPEVVEEEIEEVVEAVEIEAVEVEPVEEAQAEAEVEVEEAVVEEPQPEAEMVTVSTTDFDQIGKTGRPQFLNSFADWWSTWRANAPVVNGLKRTFEGQVDFFDLDIDDPDLDALRQAQRINNRSHYILLAPDGETVLRQWFGPLDASSMEAQLTAVLRDNGY